MNKKTNKYIQILDKNYIFLQKKKRFNSLKKQVERAINLEMK